MEYTIHTLKNDDSFERLSHRYNASVQEILDTHNKVTNANPPLKASDTIHPGQKIYIPIKHKTADNQAYIIYKQNSQRSIYTLASYYETTAETVRQFNGRPVGSPINWGDPEVNVPIKSYTTVQQTSANTQTNTTGAQQTQAGAEAEAETDSGSSLGICTVTACTEDQFIVQVMGKDHPSGQSIVVKDNKNNEIPKDSKSVIEETDQTLLSTLHEWDWNNLKDKADKKLYLKIETTGKPILLPLTNQVMATAKQLDKQYNQIVPVVPTTLIQNLDHSITRIQGYPVLARQGYFYVFKDDEPWRELKIESQDGAPIYRDINLQNPNYYDPNEKLFHAVARKPTGNPLKEIWVPSCLNKNAAGTFTFFYSEVQLSAMRLNLFIHKKEYFTKYGLFGKVKEMAREAGKDKIPAIKGTQFVDKSIRFRTKQKNYGRGSSYSQAPADNINNYYLGELAPAAELPKQRLRNDIIELSLNYPIRYIYDENNTYLSDSIDFAKEVIERRQQNQEQPNDQNAELGAVSHYYKQKTGSQASKAIKSCLSKNSATFGNILSCTLPSITKATADAQDELETGEQEEIETDENPKSLPLPTRLKNLLVGILDETYKKTPKYFEEDTQKTLWDNPHIIPFKNALQDAQNRKIYCVFVDDSHFKIRQTTIGLMQCQETMGQLVAHLTTRQYFDSAMLIHKMVMPQKFGDQPNKQRQAINSISEEGAKRLAYAGGAFERGLVMLTYDNLLKQNVSLLNDRKQLALWADHLSQLNEDNYNAAYEMLTLCLASISVTAQEVDPYMSDDGRIYAHEYVSPPIVEISDPYHPFEFLTNIVNEPESTLHRMLFCPLDTKRISQALTTDIKTVNTGLGWQRTDALRKAAQSKKDISDETKESFDGARVALMYTSDTTSLNNQNNILYQVRGVASIVVAAFTTLEGTIQKAHDQISKLKATDLRDCTEQVNASNAKLKQINDLWEKLEDKGKQLEQKAKTQTQQIDGLGQQTAEQDTKIGNTQQERTATQKTIDAIQAEKSHVNYNAYHQKLWLLEQNTDEFVEKTINGPKGRGLTGPSAFIGRIRLFQDKGAGMFWKALTFDNNRNTVGGLLKNFYVGEFTRYAGDGVTVDGYIVKVPLDGLTPDQVDTLYQQKMTGKNDIGGYGEGVSTSKGNLDPTVLDPEREMAFFVKKGTKEASLVEQALMYDQQKTPVVSEKGRLQGEINSVRFERSVELRYRQGRLSQMQIEYDAAIDKTLVTNPKEAIAASEAYLANLDAQENWAQTNLDRLDNLEVDQQNQKAALNAELETLEKQRIDTEQRLKTAVAGAKRIVNLQASESQRLNKYIENTDIVNNKIVELENNVGTAKKTILYRVANTGYFRTFIVGLQLYNFKLAWEGFQKDKFSTLVGVFSAATDLGLAIEDYIAFVTKTANQEIGLRKVLFRVNTVALPKVFQEGGKLALQPLVSGLVLIQATAGLLITIKSALEIYEAVGTRENGIVTFARWMNVASGVLAMVSPFLAVSAGALFPPILIASIVIGLAAAALIIIFSDTELEVWIKNGPFSEPNSYYSYLQDSTEAFYRLVNACAQISVTVKKEGYEGKKGLYAYRHIVEVTSLLASLLGNKPEYSTQLMLQTAGGRTRMPRLSRPKAIASGMGVRYKTLNNSTLYSYKAYAKCQFILFYQGNVLVFPAPPIVKNDTLSYKDGMNHSTPKKYTDKEPFWAGNLG